MTETLRTIVTITLTKEQLESLNRVWKKHPYAFNRSEFIREAINAYAGEQIFPTMKHEPEHSEEGAAE